MNIKKEILKSNSKVQVLKIVHYVGDDPDRFASLMEVFLKGPYRVTQRAAWPISYCVEEHPSLVLPHLRSLLEHLRTPGIHNAVRRNTMRLLQFIDIPKRLHGRVAATCFQYLKDKKEAIAVRVFSMTVLTHIAKHNPGLKNEVRMMIEDEMPYSSAGFISRGRKMLKELEEKN